MLEVIILWVTLAVFSLAPLGLSYIWARHSARKPWNVKIDRDYRPKVSIVVPTFNESKVIDYKLKNLARLDYPRSLTQTIVIDSNSTDSTVDKVQAFMKSNPETGLKVLVEEERRGKSSALNEALKSCNGDIVIISDADCFWPVDILNRTLPYLADPTVGAISGPKRLLNHDASSATRNEETYLTSMNMMKLGESKSSSTMLFEGGFSAYRKDTLQSFDPYSTGSDDSGTVIRLMEKGLKAIMIQEGEFFTVFPKTWRGRFSMKVRRAVQLIRVMEKYANLLLRNKMRVGKSVVAKNVLLYLICPLLFLLLLAMTIYMMIRIPLLLLLMLVFLIPKANTYLIEAILNYTILVYALFSSVPRKKFVVWETSEDRTLLQSAILTEKGLI
jgi:cellulose synthase/poly-beta-1,6-N-acetylglucosamine synthase-like glycosyltransferase